MFVAGLGGGSIPVVVSTVDEESDRFGRAWNMGFQSRS